MCVYDRLKEGLFFPFLLIAISWGGATSRAYAERVAFERYLMGTSVEVIVWGPDRDALDMGAERAYAEIGRIEKELSVHKKDSALSEINRCAGVSPVPVGEEIFHLVQESVRFSERSGGAFDITVEGLGDLWDLGRPDFQVPADDLLRQSLERVGYGKIRLDEKASTVFLEREGMKLSLGGIAKGYAVDRAVRMLRESGIRGGIVSAGGDLLAFGRKKSGAAWKVGVRNPRDRDRNICILSAVDLAVATSGDYERYRMIDGKRYHHIIDPRTGYPSTGCMSATVAARSAMTADALATAVFVLGPEAGLALLETLPNVEGIVVDSKGKLVPSSGISGLLEMLPE
jgi:thiamine biosynthesis lipoprotein